MKVQIFLPLLTTVAILAAFIEARYHHESTSLRHHRHERHRQAWEPETGVRGSRRRSWADEEADEDEDEEDNARTTSRRVSGEREFDRTRPARRGSDWFEPQRRGNAWAETGTGTNRRAHHPAASRRHPAPRNDRPWTYRNPLNHARRRDDLEDEEYEPRERSRGWYGDEKENFYPWNSRRSKSYEGGARSRHEVKKYESWRKRDEKEEYEDPTDDYEEEEEEEEDYESEEPEEDDWNLRKRKTGKKPDPRGDHLLLRRKKKKERVEDLNEVEEKEEDDEDVWSENDSEEFEGIDDYDETDFYSEEPKDDSNLKAIDDIIRKLTGDDGSTANSQRSTTTRRDYRNIENDKHVLGRDRHGHKAHDAELETRRPHRTVHKKTQNSWAGFSSSTTTTTTPRSYAIAASNNSSLPVKFGEMTSKRTTPRPKEDVVAVRNKSDSAASNDTEDPDVKTKSLEQDYEEYENDGNDKSDDLDDGDAETEDDKESLTEKDPDYAEEEIEDETERPSPSPSTTTTTTTTTTIPPPMQTRSFDHRQSGRVFETRSPLMNGLKSSQITTTTTTEYPPMSNYSIQKWKTLGSRKAINDRRNTMREDHSEISKAIDHVRRITKEGSCRLPKPRVISVRDVYPVPLKMYNPHCTILHRCTDDTGCCTGDRTCVPKQWHTVELVFYAFINGGATRVEKLKFDNHTECECRSRPTVTAVPNDSRNHRQPGNAPPNASNPESRKPCKCPANFVTKLTSEGECQCKCPDNQMNCLRLKRGKDYFPPADRWCIQSEQCATPFCEFGQYMRKQGRCPRKTDKFPLASYYG